MADLRTALRHNGCTQEDLDSLIGWLNHTASIMPMARHFLGRLHQRINRNVFRRKFVRFSRNELKDLKLWKRLLTKAASGISMNLITICEPTCVCWLDACPFGLGGYSVNGRAWRIRIPETSLIFGSPKVNNLLEFIAMVVNIWLECEDSTEAFQCILALGDNISAIGWLFTSSKFPSDSPAHKAHLMVARQLASLLHIHDHCLATQHIKGDANVVANLLSFAGPDRGKAHPLAYDSPTDDLLTQRFHQHLPDQIPEIFAISPLPKKDLSWVAVVLQTHELYLTAGKKA
jgi:hypothetical protein